MAKQADIFSEEGQAEFAAGLSPELKETFDILKAAGLNPRGYFSGRELRLDIFNADDRVMTLTVDLNTVPATRNWYVYKHQ
jgi:hypothetical protein